MQLSYNSHIQHRSDSYGTDCKYRLIFLHSPRAEMSIQKSTYWSYDQNSKKEKYAHTCRVLNIAIICKAIMCNKHRIDRQLYPLYTAYTHIEITSIAANGNVVCIPPPPLSCVQSIKTSCFLTQTR